MKSDAHNTAAVAKKRGGRRAGCGRPKSPDALRNGYRITLWMSRDQAAFLGSFCACNNLTSQDVIRSFLVSCMEGDIAIPTSLTMKMQNNK